MSRDVLALLAFWAVSILVMALMALGCAGRQVPACPEPTAKYDPGWCFAGTAHGKDFLLCTPSERLCDLALEKAHQISGMAGIEALSECRPATVAATVNPK